MRKINKIVNIALIFTIIVMFLCSDFAYGLRPPLMTSKTAEYFRSYGDRFSEGIDSEDGLSRLGDACKVLEEKDSPSFVSYFGKSSAAEVKRFLGLGPESFVSHHKIRAPQIPLGILFEEYELPDALTLEHEITLSDRGEPIIFFTKHDLVSYQSGLPIIGPIISFIFDDNSHIKREFYNLLCAYQNNIGPRVSLIRIKGKTVLLMNKARGKSWEECPPDNQEDMKEFIYQVARAFAILHKNHLTKGEIKSRDIFWDRDERGGILINLIDFGTVPDNFRIEEEKSVLLRIFKELAPFKQALAQEVIEEQFNQGYKEGNLGILAKSGHISIDSSL